MLGKCDENHWSLGKPKCHLYQHSGVPSSSFLLIEEFEGKPPEGLPNLRDYYSIFRVLDANQAIPLPPFT